MKGLRNSFISGLLLLSPVAVTVLVIDALITNVGKNARDAIFFFIPKEADAGPWSEYALWALSFLAVMILITLLGWFSKKLVGRIAINLFERLVDNVPIVRSLYNTVKQIRDTFVQQQKAVFQQVVLVEYPRKGVYVVGFLTSQGKGEVLTRTGQELLNIFVPTTPNPTSGFLLMVPRPEVTFMDMSVTDGMKLIISGGAVVPPHTPKANSPAQRAPEVETAAAGTPTGLTVTP